MKKKKIKYEVESLIDPVLLTQLSEKKIWSVVSKIAMNENTPPDVLEKLGKDPRPSILWRVAGNKNTPFKTLDVLSKHSQFIIKVAVAKNPNTSIATLQNMIHSTDLNIQIWTEARKNFDSRDILEDLLK